MNLKAGLTGRTIYGSAILGALNSSGGTLIKETQNQLSKLKEKVKSIEHRFSTHQVQEIMKKEEKDHKKIHLLKKQVALMHGEHQEFDKEGF